MAAVTHSQLGEILAQHHDSLPRHSGFPGWLAGWPWVVLYVVLPAVGAALIQMTDLTLRAGASEGLLAGVGVLTGLLFQVLASVAGRVATIADTMPSTGARPEQIRLLRRLDIARANIAYATMLSIANITWLGLLALFDYKARWPVSVSAFLLVHLAFTLLLVLVRVNQIGQDDRIAALTRHASGP